MGSFRFQSLSRLRCPRPVRPVTRPEEADCGFPTEDVSPGPPFFSFVLIPPLPPPLPPPRTPLGLKTRPMEHPKGPPASSFSDVCSKLALSEADLRLIFFLFPLPPPISSLLQHSLSLSSSFPLSLLFLFCRTYMFVVGQGLVC